MSLMRMTEATFARNTKNNSVIETDAKKLARHIKERQQIQTIRELQKKVHEQQILLDTLADRLSALEKSSKPSCPCSSLY